MRNSFQKPRIRYVDTETSPVWGQKCACGHRVRVGQHVAVAPLAHGKQFLEHVECLRAHLDGRGRGLHQPGGPWRLFCHMSCDNWFNPNEISWWRAPGGHKTFFGIHHGCLNDLIANIPADDVPILQKDIDAELARLKL